MQLCNTNLPEGPATTNRKITIANRAGDTWFVIKSQPSLSFPWCVSVSLVCFLAGDFLFLSVL